VITIFPEQIHICHILIFESHGLSSLEHEHGVILSAQGTGKGSTTSTTADDDDVVMAVANDHDGKTEGSSDLKTRMDQVVRCQT
jgi:hypothetical protein